MELKIIAYGNYWVCSNMDTLAPIIEEGVEYLLSDGRRVRINDHHTEEDLKELKGLCMATVEERKQFASQEYGYIFKGQKVVIKRGRKYLNEIKEVKGYYRYEVPGTYGRQYTEYLLFTDGTKVNILHCDVENITHKEVNYNGKLIYYRHYEENLGPCTFNVGGRI